MARKIGRREFLEKSGKFGYSAALGTGLVTHFLGSPFLSWPEEKAIDISVVVGRDYHQSTMRAVELLGGMERFVPKNSKVALLPNTQSKNPGTYTRPEIVRSVIQICKKAGAKEINCLSWLPEKYWEATGLKKAVGEEGASLKITNLKDSSLFKTVAIPKGKLLKEAKILAEFFNHDVFIDMPIAKDHVGNRFTGTMKNLMGLDFPEVNKFFHTGDKDYPDDIEHLDQCIADLNTIISPALCVVDATAMITTNGPFGPGELIYPERVVAGTDRVAVDSYCTTFL